MKKVFSKITGILMATVVLFSTMSFTIDMHYCGDILVDTAIFSKAEGCGMEMNHSSSSSSSSSEENISNKNCCSETVISIDGDEEFTTTFKELTFEQQTFVATFVYTYINLFEVNEDNSTSFLDYSPPLVVKDILLLDEQFLI
ncbi:MAG: hypothetical protein L3J09_03795 [Flavobacteriaceae bacterium]|nr:hypothetical protein [Flavobacteriaceae bacterium]